MAHLSSPCFGADKPTILVIEDNADQWFLIRWALLQRFSEVEPIWIADPVQAIQYLESCLDDARELPQLILLDLYLPTSQTGLDTLKQLKKSEKLFREIPVVILSQFRDGESVRAAYDSGANSYVAKPLTYATWLDCFAMFRHYWWKEVRLPEFDHWESERMMVDNNNRG